MKKKKNKNMEKKKLLYYEKDKFEELVKQFPEGDRIVFPISYLTNQNTALQYTGIDKVKHFVIDITAMVMSARERKDLRLIYESWINFLNKKMKTILIIVWRKRICMMHARYLVTILKKMKKLIKCQIMLR